MASPDTINELVSPFEDGIKTMMDRSTSILKQCVNYVPVSGEKQFTDAMGINHLMPKTGRNIPVPLSETERFRRWMHQKDFWGGERVDTMDRLRERTDPTGALAKAWAIGGSIRWDLCAIEAALGPVQVGKHQIGGTLASLPNSQIIPHGGTGLTTQKILQGVEMLRRVGNSRDPMTGSAEPIILWKTERQQQELLNSPTVTSNDYYNGRPLMDAHIPYWGGAHMYVCNDVLDLSLPPQGGVPDGTSGTFTQILPLDQSVPATPIRYCIMHLKSAINIGELRPFELEINPEKRYGIHAQMLQCEMSVGGNREHESKVVVIECIDTSPLTFGN